jgi:long-chain fatty acid transport protein
MRYVRMPQCVLGAWLALTSVGFADGVILNGTSPRSIGRGGTNIAEADTAGVILDNPAGIVNIDSDRLFEVGSNFMFAQFSYSDPLRSGSSSEFAPLPEGGFIRKSADGQWAFGIGAFAPAGFLENYNLSGPFPFLGPQHYHSIGTLGKVLPSLAYRLTDNLTVGTTLGVAVSHDEFAGPYTLQAPGMFRGVPTLIDLKATGASLCWSLGLQYKLTDVTTLGLTYQSESRFEATGTTNVVVPGLGASTYDSELDITWPRSLGLGVRHELTPNHIFSADVIWFNWANAFDALGITLTNPTTPGFPPIVEQLPLNWTDSVSARFGYEWVVRKGNVLRFGYVYNQDPIPDGTLTPFIQATLQHTFSIGYGTSWRSWDFDFGYMVGVGPQHYVATSELIGGEFNQSTHNGQVHCAAFSVIKRY